MAIAPITGKLRKRLWLDVTMAMGLGTSAAYAWWYGYHIPAQRRQEEFYLKLEREKQAQA